MKYAFSTNSTMIVLLDDGRTAYIPWKTLRIALREPASSNSVFYGLRCRLKLSECFLREFLEYVRWTLDGQKPAVSAFISYPM